ncbi:uncharacterized protein LOC128234340 [Mya arenaria]|uniref:uncharacterized protein LOC128234340 n=1 Tax=Mya arenaria TaxID=6604 RepID=UPI0022E05DB4|nr:uncharacterized protein LOC128234340 [Mya arenaria]
MMGYNVCIFKILYILCFLPSLYCEVCGTLQNLNNGTINRGDDVRLEFSNFDRKHTDLVRWWKNDKNIDTTLPRFSVDVQHGRVTLIICSFTVEDNGGYSVSFGGIQCSPPKTILITVKEPKVLSAIPQFPDNVTIPELDCEQCLVGTVGVYINVECVVFGISKKDLNIELKLKKNGQQIPNVTVEGSPFYRAYYAYTPSEEDTDHTVTCEASRDGQQAVTVSITLLVLRKDNSSSMLIEIVCGCVVVLIIVMIVVGCVVLSKRRNKRPMREGPCSVHIQERQPSVQLQGLVFDNRAESNHGVAPSEVSAEPVEYACVVKKAERQAAKPKTEEGALIYADLDLPTESSTRGKSTVSLDAGTTYVSIDLTQTEKKKRSELND